MHVLLSLGSNLGDRKTNLEAALAGMEAEGLMIVRVSSAYETEPVGYTDQPWFLNIAAEIETSLQPRGLLDRCLKVEQHLGRTRSFRGAPRTVDLDILLWGATVVDEANLKIPHPRMAERKFVLVPLAEIAPGAIHPLLKQPIVSLLESCGDPSLVRPYLAEGPMLWPPTSRLKDR